MMTTRNKQPLGGEIVADAVYPLNDFMRRTGLGEKSLRQARRAGFPVRRYGGRAFVIGRDWIVFLEQSVAESPGPNSPKESALAD